jgi:pimeloyl-ACP methyl ester carboxylesterase
MDVMDGGPMRWWLVRLGLILGLTVPGAAHARFMGVYDYPFVSPLAATVAATPPANQARQIPAREFAQLVENRFVVPFPQRRLPPVFWYFSQGMPYTVLKQNRPFAPLFFIIGGTGAGHDSAKSYGLANVLYQAGFHVVSLPSPTHSSFIVTASGDSVPGQLQNDARDLYRVMGMIAADLAQEIAVSRYHVGGYSLGATHAAFVSQLDRTEQRFRFESAVMINPAVNLYDSVNRLDAMVADNLAQDQEGVSQFIDRLFDQIVALYNSNDQVDFADPAFVYRAYSTLEPPESELELLIGLAFRLTSNDMAFTSDVMTNAAYVVPKNARLTATTSLTDVMLEGLRLNFVDYFDGLYVPALQRREPGVTREELIARASLRSIEGYLRQDQRVVLLGTQDDVILSRDEMLWLGDVFGERARIFPTGGHCGSMDQREFVREMLRLLFDREARS